jgi:phosphocarrier protein
MKQFNYTVADPLGIHARPAGMLAKEAKSFGDTVVTVTKDGNTVKTSQLMKLMSLGVKQGDTITISAEGSAEDTAIAAMEKFLKENL